MAGLETKLEQLIQELTPISTLLLVLWLLTMVSVPILRWTVVRGAERLGITAGVYAQAALVVGILWLDFGAAPAVLLALVIALAGWLVEFLGSKSGIPFGSYEYTDVLKPQIAGVPLLIPLAWLMMLPPSWAVAGALLGPEATPLAYTLVAAAAFTAWDLYLDPLMVSWNFWQWERRGVYFGIPLVNFLGWFLAAAAITGIARLLVPPLFSAPSVTLLAVYGVTALLQAAGQFFFWRLRGPALCGLAAMGGCALLAFF